jgi:predicted Fe-S protein YdhL (DUF1289 family)
MDERTGLCLGCRRSLYEIAAWTRFTDDERRAIMADLPVRTQAPPMPRAARRGGRAARLDAS